MLDDLANSLGNRLDRHIRKQVLYVTFMFWGGVLGVLFLFVVFLLEDHRVLVHNGTSVSVEVTAGSEHRTVAPGQTELLRVGGGSVRFAARGPGIDEAYRYSLSRGMPQWVVYNVGGVEQLGVVSAEFTPNGRDVSGRVVSIEELGAPVTLLDEGTWIDGERVDAPFQVPQEPSGRSFQRNLCRIGPTGGIGCPMPEPPRPPAPSRSIDTRPVLLPDSTAKRPHVRPPPPLQPAASR